MQHSACGGDRKARLATFDGDSKVTTGWTARPCDAILQAAAQVTKAVVKAYVKQAIAVEKAGLRVDTRTARIEKCIPGILAGVGMNDR